MEKYQIKANKRTIVGRKVKQLRKKGLLPGNIYGNKIKSQTVEVPLSEFRKVFQKAGETKIVELILGKNEVHPVLIHNVQVDPLSGSPLHADFYQINLKQKVRTEVPIELIGESPAVIQKTGLLLQTLNKVEVEALPTDLPEKITIDVTPLTTLDQELKVSDLKVPTSVTILTNPNLGVVKVGELVSKEAEALAKEEEVATAAAKAQAAAEAGVAAAEAPATPEEVKEGKETTSGEAQKAEEKPQRQSHPKA